MKIKITSLKKEGKEKVEIEGARNVWKQVPISRADGAPTFSFRVFTIEPQGYTPLHTHPFEHGNYVIGGSGAVVTEEDERPIKNGDFVFVAPNERHRYKNTSKSEPFVMICAVPKDHE